MQGNQTKVDLGQKQTHGKTGRENQQLPTGKRLPEGLALPLTFLQKRTHTFPPSSTEIECIRQEFRELYQCTTPQGPPL